MSEPKEGGPLLFGDNPPHVDPRVTNPAVREYQLRMAQRSAPRTQPLIKYGEQVNGGPTPHIPRLDQQHVEGQTMAAQARPSIIEQQQPGAAPAQQGMPDIKPTDLLPPEAQQDPSFQQGFGAMYAISQPHLAMKYGVMRGNQRLSPQQLAGNVGKEGQQLRPETIKDMETLRQIQEGKKLEEQARQAEDERQQAEAEQAAKDSPAAAAKTFGRPPTPPSNSEEMDTFDIDGLHTLIAENELNTREQREEIEKRLAPIDLADLVMTGRVRQVIPIVPGTFEPVLQNLSPEDDLACKRLIVTEAKTVDVQNDRYLLDKFALMGLTCALVRVHKNLPDLPDYRGQDGDFDEKLFWAKFKKVIKLPLPMIASLAVHYSWMDTRLRRLFRVEKVKNG